MRTGGETFGLWDKTSPPLPPAGIRARADQIWGVILAAGESQRMGTPKAFVELGHRNFLRRAIELFSTSRLPACVVISDHLRGHPSDLGTSPVLTNPRPQAGPLSSLQVALRRLVNSRAVILFPVDHALVKSVTIRRLVAVHKRVPSSILIPQWHGHKGHPVLFPRRFFSSLLRAPLEEGARGVVRRNSSYILRVPVPDRGVCLNLNTPGSVRRWRHLAAG